VSPRQYPSAAVEVLAWPALDACDEEIKECEDLPSFAKVLDIGPGQRDVLMFAAELLSHYGRCSGGDHCTDTVTLLLGTTFC